MQDSLEVIMPNSKEPDPIVTLDELSKAGSLEELDALLLKAAENCKYTMHLNVTWDYWHYGRHAEFAEEVGKPEMTRLFSEAWKLTLILFNEAENDTVNSPTTD
jgi:hypothetical protein